MAASWLKGFVRNWSDLAEDDSDPMLRPVPLSRPPAGAVTWAAGILSALPRWKGEAADPVAGTIRAVHLTRLWGFRDDVRIRFVPEGTGSRVFAHSRARIGKGDLGQNARNLRELTRALRKASDSAPS